MILSDIKHMSAVLHDHTLMPPVHRKPVPVQSIPAPAPQHTMQSSIQQRPLQPPIDQSSSLAGRGSAVHSRTRTASSNILPYITSQQAHPPLPAPSTAAVPHGQISYNINPTTKRTLSNATTSTSSTSGPLPMRSNSGNSLQRTISSRSGNSASSYVTLMRRQKATVWSDRAQFEDPRLAAQQRLAKQRAFIEMSGAAGSRISTSGSSSITGGVRSKIRHHGTPKALLYAPTAAPGTGVPMRLSAREVDEDDSGDDRSIHRRNGSGRSSLGSSGRAVNTHGPTHTTINSNSDAPSSHDIRKDPEQTPMPEKHSGSDYFRPRIDDRAGSPISRETNDNEQENNFGAVKALPRRLRGTAEEEAAKMDLARRGSVDERTMTMSGYKLFVANPDLDD